MECGWYSSSSYSLECLSEVGNVCLMPLVIHKDDRVPLFAVENKVSSDFVKVIELYWSSGFCSEIWDEDRGREWVWWGSKWCGEYWGWWVTVI